MIAVPLAFGNLTAEHYEDEFHHSNPIIDALREKMTVEEEPRYTTEYLESEKRSIANSLQVFFKDGSVTDEIEINYPVGHRRRRRRRNTVTGRKIHDELTHCLHKRSMQCNL